MKKPKGLHLAFCEDCHGVDNIEEGECLDCEDGGMVTFWVEAKLERENAELRKSIGLAISLLGAYRDKYLDYEREENTSVPIEDDLDGIRTHLEGSLMDEPSGIE